jgi:glycine/D-amino acid oxidase-like deaminating enzyme
MTRPAVAEVGVVGAGVHGASAAYHLARRGVATTVFERGRPAGGPTGRSSGICRAYYTQPFLAEVARDSIAFLAEFADRTGGQDSGFVRTGGLYLHGPGDEQHAQQTVTTLRGLGIGIETLDAQALARRFPGVDADGVAVAVREADAGYADPYRTTTGLVAAAQAHGATFGLGKAVVGLVETPSHVVVSTSDGQTHRAERPLVAAVRPRDGWQAPSRPRVRRRRRRP